MAQLKMKRKNKSQGSDGFHVRCHVHFITNLMKVISRKHWHGLIDAIHNALDKSAPSKETRNPLEQKGLS